MSVNVRYLVTFLVLLTCALQLPFCTASFLCISHQKRMISVRVCALGIDYIDGGCVLVKAQGIFNAIYFTNMTHTAADSIFLRYVRAFVCSRLSFRWTYFIVSLVYGWLGVHSSWRSTFLTTCHNAARSIEIVFLSSITVNVLGDTLTILNRPNSE